MLGGYICRKVGPTTGSGAGAWGCPNPKPAIALDQIRQAVAEEVAAGVILADAAYGSDNRFRAGIRELEMRYVVGVQGTMTVWRPGQGPLPKKRWKRKGRPPTLLRRDAEHQPVSLKQLALELPETAWQTVSWREGTKTELERLAAHEPNGITQTRSPPSASR